MNKQTTTIIVLVLIIISIVGVMAYNKVRENAYDVGFQNAVTIINNQITSNLQQQGYIMFMYPINATNTLPLKLVPYIENIE